MEEKKEILKKKKSLLRWSCEIIFYFFLFFALCSSIIGLVNFHQIEQKKEPFFAFSINRYENEEETITVYHYLLYKVVKVEEDTQTNITLKLFFLDD